MIESAIIAIIWIAIGFGAGVDVSMEIVRRTTRPVQVNVRVDPELINDFCLSRNMVLVPRGPEWTPKAGERLQ
ncbi:MAG: hypothetical protein MZW92_32000 [Comamonadaceae bacterium]|nr:hypothetical protein [Comamonadaceae bacterium]